MTEENTCLKAKITITLEGRIQTSDTIRTDTSTQLNNLKKSIKIFIL